MIRPPRLIHIRYKREDDRQSLVKDCSKALHMSKGERALLSFYASSSSGFRPSLEHIAKETGQNRSQVYRNRYALMDHGVIGFDGRDVVVDWNRVKIFASLDPKLTKKGMKCAPVVTRGYVAKTVTVEDLECKPMDELLADLGRMTAEEFRDLQAKVKKMKRS